MAEAVTDDGFKVGRGWSNVDQREKWADVELTTEHGLAIGYFAENEASVRFVWKGRDYRRYWRGVTFTKATAIRRMRAFVREVVAR